jgi:hypothetical protein
MKPCCREKTKFRVSGVEVKAVDEGVRAASRREVSAAPVTNAEKWSHEAIVSRSNMRATRAYAETESCGEFRAESGL